MKDYYLSSEELIINKKLSDQEFRIYSYICSAYGVAKHSAFIRLVDIAGHFHLQTADVIKILEKFTLIEIDNKKLFEIHKTEKGLKFFMPYYKSFLEGIGFKGSNFSFGFKNVQNKIKNLQTDLKIYLFPKLDQFDLSDVLRDMPDEDFEKIKPDQLRFPWVYHDEKARRTDTQ